MPIQTRRGASVSLDPQIAARELYDALAMPELALAIFYCSPRYDLEALGAALARLFGPAAPLIGCTTAGEISPLGYREGSITGTSLGGAGVFAHTEMVDRLRELELARGEAAAGNALDGMRDRGLLPHGGNCFGLLLCDGLAMQEEALVSTLYTNL